MENKTTTAGARGMGSQDWLATFYWPLCLWPACLKEASPHWLLYWTFKGTDCTFPCVKHLSTTDTSWNPLHAHANLVSILPKTGSPSSGKRVSSNKYKRVCKHKHKHVHTWQEKHLFKRVLTSLLPFLNNWPEDKKVGTGRRAPVAWCGVMSLRE